MRCPKCGYISFDHLDSCRKCHRPIAQTGFKGTTYPGIVPVFLQPSQQTADNELDEGVVVEDIVDILDPDLDLLAEKSETAEGQPVKDEIIPGDDFELAFGVDQKEEDLSLDEEDLSIDISRFADVPINMQAVQEPSPVQPVQFAIPEGLADISDLARPAVEGETKHKIEFPVGDDDLNIDDLDLSFDAEKTNGAASLAGDDKLASVSLDDIDLSGGLELTSSPLPSRPVDDDLNFDLDLGAHEKPNKPARGKKPDDDLPELTLTLD
jgi:hypothetical protein